TSRITAPTTAAMIHMGLVRATHDFAHALADCLLGYGQGGIFDRAALLAGSHLRKINPDGYGFFQTHRLPLGSNGPIWADLDSRALGKSLELLGSLQISSASAPPASSSVASAPPSRPTPELCGCATPRSSTACAKGSTSASVRCSRATRARSPRR